jgi:hypothetical protein
MSAKYEDNLGISANFYHMVRVNYRVYQKKF